MMACWVAPTALRMPISRVRSVTETSMMFMIPMPATSMARPPMPPSTKLKRLSIRLTELRMLAGVSTMKSVTCSWRRRSVAQIWSAASSTRSGETALASIVLSHSPPSKRLRTTLIGTST
ncbi:MAG: hypothetical protein AUJ96_26535 [Armatimonadetes bacterium CG2_30_66_41]|nr:MAG: hypothetical protein AUJ96_26535 [Armatimonadetes bacterium CG2_30_66_41]